MGEAAKEFENTKKELSAVYVRISKLYVRMSKTSDSFTFGIIQSGIDNEVSRANVLREKLEAKKKEMFEEWDKIKKETPVGYNSHSAHGGRTT